MNCAFCGHENVQKRGFKKGKQVYQCNQCHRYFRIKEESRAGEESSSFTETDNSIHIVCDSRRVMSRDDLVDQFKIDLNQWEVKSFTVKTSEGYRKDRKVRWKVKDGKVTEGDVDDTGKMLIVPMYHTSLELVRRKQLSEQMVNDLFKNISLKDLSPIKIVPSQYDENGLYAIVPIADLHLGLCTTSDVEGNEYNVELAEQYFYSVISQAVEKLRGKKIKEIVFILGNDMLNSDNLQNTTEHGTPQDTRISWFYLIDKAVEMAIRGTNTLLEISKVRLINVPSNHDRHSMYGVMKAVELYFRNNENVVVDNRPLYTKYLMVGGTLLGLTHDIDIKRALSTITTEAKAYWSGATHAIWLLGHLHKAMQYEQQGIMEVYRLPTVSGNSRWSSEKHFVQSDRRTQFFLLDENNGVVDIMNIIVG